MSAKTSAWPMGKTAIGGVSRSGLSALSRSPMGQLPFTTRIMPLVDQSIDEGIAVGKAMNYNLSNDLKRTYVGFL
ncbi:MAG: hypothetical protein CM1200mP41_33580 [Gammaproteobacteria bacterium]|nr:MAG: hypothetical protein CM1200mP41_33580 [Gammaproteobacteria bacterium]